MVNLDSYQIEALKSLDEKVLVIAPPGSGKTTVIINRVKYLIQNRKVNANNIIVITFTKAAANNMKERFIALNVLGSPFFGTFHGLFYKIVIRHFGKIEIINTSVSFNLIKSIMQTKIEEVSDEKIKEVINCISYYKTRNEIKEDSKIDKELFFECYKGYEEYKDQKKLFDFDDLAIRCRDLLINDEKLRRGYRSLFRHILVDEFQDCDPLQIEILKILTKGNSLFAVGDEDQCIYSFRGSDPKCMVDFNETFEKGVKKHLIYNYRSTKNIVEASVDVISKNKNRNIKKTKAFRENIGKFNILTPFSESLEVDDIKDKVCEYVSKGRKYKDNAVIYRTNIGARSVIDGFIINKIPFKLLDGEYNFYDHFICKDLISYLKLSVDPYDSESFIRVINKPFRYVSKKILDKIRCNKYKENAFVDLLNSEDLHPYQMKKLDELYKEICYLNKISLSGTVDYILNSLDYREYILDYSNKYNVNKDELEEIVEEFKASLEGFKTITTFLVHVQGIKQKIKESRNSNLDGVILSTIHGVKGMEFKNVFMIDVNEDILPHKNAKEENFEEERRLFFVGITRAIDNLYIYSPKKIRGDFKNTSIFLRESNLQKYIKKEESDLKSGDLINHKTYGVGKVGDLNGDEITVCFNDGVVRRFSVSVLIENKIIDKLEK